MWQNILKKCSCEKDSNTEALEKVSTAGGFTVASAPALYQPTFSGKKRKCKKCQRK